jgi:hypothetical protein
MPPTTKLTQAEQAILLEGGVKVLSPRPALVLRRLVDRRTRAAHDRLIARSLAVDQAVDTLGVNAYRVRQRLNEGTLYDRGLQQDDPWLDLDGRGRGVD